MSKKWIECAQTPDVVCFQQSWQVRMAASTEFVGTRPNRRGGSRFQRPPHHDETSPIAISPPTPCSSDTCPYRPIGFPCRRVSLSLVIDSPWLLKLIELIVPETMASLVNAVWFATRRVMRNGAMTCSAVIRKPWPEIAASGESTGSTNLGSHEDREEDSRSVIIGRPASNKH